VTTPARVLAIATKFGTDHYKEGNNNDSIFGRWYGLNFQPWCAMFVSYCFNMAGAGELVNVSTKKGFASCTAAVAGFKKRKQLIKTVHARPGDIVFFNFDKNPDADHVGIVISNDLKSKVLHCIEGNTINPSGAGVQSNGDGVYFKTRPYRLVVAVARPKWTSLPEPTPVDDEPVKVTPKRVVKKAVVKPAPKPAAKPAVKKNPSKTYVVQAGDSYWKIADDHNLEFKKLQQLNKSKALHPGDVIRLN
jgi:LysM repeat protein